eukprot:3932565-Rhodomonas_salina.1
MGGYAMRGTEMGRFCITRCGVLKGGVLGQGGAEEEERAAPYGQLQRERPDPGTRYRSRPVTSQAHSVTSQAGVVTLQAQLVTEVVTSQGQWSRPEHTCCACAERCREEEEEEEEEGGEEEEEEEADGEGEDTPGSYCAEIAAYATSVPGIA